MEQLRLAKKVIFNRVRWGHRFFLLVDLDGTLVPVKFDGPPAKLKSSLRQDLADLTAMPHTSVGIVSERPLSDFAKQFAGMSVHLCGSLGLEHSQAAGIPIRIELNHNATLINQLQAEIKKLGTKVRGVKTERLGGFLRIKGVGTESARSKVMDLIGDRARLLRISRTKNTFGIIQETGHDKGTAAAAALRKVGFVIQSDICIYIGDDETDEAAFATLGGFAVTVRVGKDDQSKAKYFARDMAEVHKFIGELAEVRSEHSADRGQAGQRMF